MNQLPANLNYVVANAYAPSAPEVFLARSPTPNDTQYAIQQRWFDTANNSEWLLIGFTSFGGVLQAQWVDITSGGGLPNVEQFLLPDTNIITPTGTPPTVTFQNGSGITITQGTDNHSINIAVTGGGVAIENVITDTGSGTPLTGTTINLNSAAPYATATGPNAIAVTATDSTHGKIALQLAGANNTTATPNDFGIAQFDGTQFSVTSGFVQLKGATGNPAIQDVDLDNATTPIFAASNGHISLKGGTIQNTGTSATAIQTSGSSSNDAKINLQFAGSNPSSSTANNFGVAQFDGNQFSVTSGFVKLKSGSLPAFQQVVRQVFTSSGTYTPTTNMVFCDIEVLGGGGGGGGVVGGNTLINACGGGSSGGYGRGIFSAATIGGSQTVTVGAGGIGGVATTGGNGGATSVGALISVNGGGPGLVSVPVGGGVSESGQAAVAGSGGDFQTRGTPGNIGFISGSTNQAIAGNGGSSFFGGGAWGGFANTGLTTNGHDGNSYGAGGSGACSQLSASDGTGGAGAAGIVIITEYIS